MPKYTIGAVHSHTENANNLKLQYEVTGPVFINVYH